MKNQLLQIQQVSKVFPGYPWVTALTGIDFQVISGEFVVILGPSGCGKTTLLRLLAGLEKPSSGLCRYRGQEIDSPSLAISYLFQEPRLFPWLTVAENMGLSGHSEGLTALARRMGLADFLKSFPHQLSGGMAKRVSLARALLANPEVLLLDEPLANLDLPTKIGLQQELISIWRRGITSIMVTHDLDEALAVASRILLFSPRPGRIIHDVVLDMDHPRSQDDQRYLLWKRQIMNWTMEVLNHESTK